MQRVVMERATLNKLRRVSDSLGTRYTSVLSLLIVGHHQSIGESSRDWLRELDSTPIVHLASVAISQDASNIAMGLAHAMGCKKGSAVTAIVQDCLPLLESMPETIPGMKSLTRFPSRDRRSIGLHKSTRTRIAARCRRLAEEGEKRISAAAYVRNALYSLPSSEIEKSLLSEEFAEALLRHSNTGPVSAITVDVGLSEYLESLRAFTGCSITRIVSFLLEKELQTTEKELVYKQSILALDPVARWKTILSDYIRSGISV